MFLISVGALFPFSVIPVSSQAVVNARLSRVRSPTEGELGQVRLETGDSVTAGEALTTVSNPLNLRRSEATGDQRTLSDLQVEADRVGAELSASLLEKGRYDGMFSQYVGHRAQDVEGEAHEAQAEASGAQARIQSAQQEVQRDQQALADHLIPRSTLDAAQDKLETAQRDAAQKTAAVRRLQGQASEARSGFSGAGPEPSFIAARETATTNVDRLRAEKAALDQRMQAMKAGARTLSTGAADGGTDVDSPVSGFIWSRSVATGQSMQQGEDMFSIADSHSIHVEVWLDRRYGPQLSIGDMALVYLSGMGRELKGRVTSFEGTSRRTNEEEVNAIDLQAVHPDQYHVSIELQPADRKAQYIGQAAKVLFPGAQHPLRADLYFWLTRL